MIVDIYGEKHICDRAVKGTNFVRLYDDQNNLTLSCEGINDFSGYVIDDGVWEQTINPTLDQRTAALESAMLTILGGATNV